MKKELLTLIQSNFNSEKYFLVDVSVVMLRNIPKIIVTADSDSGIGIDECAELSRELSKLVEESQLVENYEIEVSSPGVGEPLVLERQYVKNIGRMVKVVANDGRTLKGKLIEVVQNQYIAIEEKIKIKGKKEQDTIIHQIQFSDIKKTSVEVSFN